MARYVLCRPVGGLNDILCQIERCCRYAHRFDRTVVVETNFPRARFIRDRFDRYFASGDPRLVLSVEAVGGPLPDDDVLPTSLCGRLADYRAQFHAPTDSFVEFGTGLPLTFDFDADHPQRVLLHHQPGGGPDSLDCLARMTIQRPLAEELARRWAAIGPGYEAIHVRHTDYRSDFRFAIQALGRAAPERLFVATDNGAVLKAFRRALGVDRVFSFSLLRFVPGEPIHKLLLGPEHTYERNRDAVLDLLMLALARNLYLLPVEEQDPPLHSGYSLLAQALHENPAILRRLIADPRFDAAGPAAAE
ncbi:MAG: hypothetical protein AB7O45_01670 [Alphaproteobacteria bacterium]